MPIQPDVEPLKKKKLTVKKLPRCRGCDNYNEIVNKTAGYCFSCNRCQMCGVTQVDDDSQFCKWCRCQDCGLSARRTVLDSDGAVTTPDGDKLLYFCQPCLFKRHPEKACVLCKKEMAAYFVRFEKRTKLANIGPQCRGRVQGSRCWFCDTAIQYGEKNGISGQYKAYGIKPTNPKTYLVCHTCSSTPICGRNGCTPVNPCESCRNPIDHHADQHMASQDLIYGGGFYFKQPPIFHEVRSISQRKENRSTRLLGVEIEVAGLRVNKEKPTHIVNGRCLCPSCHVQNRTRLANYVRKIGGSIVSDESLPAGGIEITMPPAGGDIFMEQITTVSDMIYDAGGYVNEKCGTHVHVDARDFTTQDMRKLLMLWVKTEPAFLLTQDAKRIYKPKSHCFPTAEKYRKLLSEKLTSKNAEEWSSLARESLNDAIYSSDWPRPPRLMRGNNRTITAR